MLCTELMVPLRTFGSARRGCISLLKISECEAQLNILIFAGTEYTII